MQQGTSNGQELPAAAATAAGAGARVGAAARLHPGTRAFLRQWMEDHPRLSRPLAWLRDATGLPKLWISDDRLEKSRVLRWIDASVPVFLGVFLVGLVVNLVEPFGLDNATKARSQQVSARMMAPFYGSDAQDHIAVVLIDDASLRARGIGWPPQYAFYDEMLGRILAHRPRAVYVDVFLEERRSYDDSYAYAWKGLNDTLESAMRPAVAGATGVAAGERIPVFFGVSAPGRTSLFDGTGVQTVAASWQGVGNAYPLMIGKEREFTAGEDGGGGDDADRRSVALALYQAACPDARASGCFQAASALSAQALALPMWVQWGSSLPVLAEPWPKLDCFLHQRPSAFARVWQSMRLVLHSFRSGMSDGIEDRKREHCPYTLTVFEDELEADALLDGGPGGKAMLEDRVVLVGTHLLGLNDRVTTPVHQQVPGVYMHAMALDNLMTWGDGRIHAKPHLGRMLGLLNAMLMSLACGAVLLMQRSLLRTSLMLVAPLLVGVLMGVLAQCWLDQPPADWIGIVVLVVGMTFYVKSRIDKAEGLGEKTNERIGGGQEGIPGAGTGGAVGGAGDADAVDGSSAGPGTGAAGAGADGGAGAPPAGGL